MEAAFSSFYTTLTRRFLVVATNEIYREIAIVQIEAIDDPKLKILT